MFKNRLCKTVSAAWGINHNTLKRWSETATPPPPPPSTPPKKRGGGGGAEPKRNRTWVPLITAAVGTGRWSFGADGAGDEVVVVVGRTGQAAAAGVGVEQLQPVFVPLAVQPRLHSRVHAHPVMSRRVLRVAAHQKAAVVQRPAAGTGRCGRYQDGRGLTLRQTHGTHGIFVVVRFWICVKFGSK